MRWAIVFVTLVALGHMVYTDFRYRYIQSYVVLLLAILTGAQLWIEESPTWNLYLFNLGYTIALFAISLCIVSLKRGSWHWQTFIGRGDVFLLIPLCFWLDTWSFILWFNVSLLATLVFHGILRQQTWYNNPQSIPLAGYFSVTFGVTLLYTTTIDA